LPVVAFRFTDDFQKQYPDIEQAWVQHKLREEGWIVPNYALPPTLEKTEILRVVIRENFNAEMVERLVESLFNVYVPPSSRRSHHLLTHDSS
jgi:glutamate decarboxylase